MARINREPEVARYLNRPVDQSAVAGFYGVIAAHWDQHGFGPWALESLEPAQRGSFLGFAGLAFVPSFLSAAGSKGGLGLFSPAATYKRPAWSCLRPSGPRPVPQSYKTLPVARDDAFGRLEQTELISIIHPRNERSQRVALKLGMRRERQIANPVLRIEVDVWHLRAGQTVQGDR